MFGSDGKVDHFFGLQVDCLLIGFVSHGCDGVEAK